MAEDSNVDDFLRRGLDKLSTQELADRIMPSDERRKQLNAPLPANGTIQLKLAPADVHRLEDSAHFSELQNGTCKIIQPLNPERCRVALLIWGQLLCDCLHACFLDEKQIFELLQNLESWTKPGMVPLGQPVCLFDVCTGGEHGNPKNPWRPQLIYMGDYQLAKKTLLKFAPWIHEQAMKTWQAERDAIGPSFNWPQPVLLTKDKIARPGRIASGQDGSMQAAIHGPSPNHSTFRQHALSMMPEVPAPYPPCVLPSYSNRKKP